MARGGARARSGPAPDPNALSRARDSSDWTVLPAEGRKGLVPEWPLPGPVGREVDLWERLWSKPQAVAWEQQGQEYEVALYVRRFAEAELPDSPVTLSTLVRQMADSLGLTTPGLRGNRWRIGNVEKPAETKARRAAAPARDSSRSRFKVVRDDDDGA